MTTAKQQKGGDANSGVVGKAVDSLTSDGTVKCSACGGRIPAGERYSIVSPDAEGVPEIIRGGSIHEMCAASEWIAKPAPDAYITWYGTLTYEFDKLDLSDEVGGAISVFSNSKASRTDERTYFVNRLKLEKSIHDAGSFFVDEIRKHSHMGAHAEAIKCADDAIIVFRYIAKSLNVAKDRLVNSAYQEDQFPLDPAIVECLKDGMKKVADILSMIDMYATAELYLSSRGSPEDSLVLARAAERFDSVMVKDAHLEGTTENAGALLFLTQGMVNAHGAPTAVSFYASETLKRLALHMFESVTGILGSISANLQYRKTVYLALADTFALLGMPKNESHCHFEIMQLYMELGELLLEKANDSLERREFDERMPMWARQETPDKQNALLSAISAKENFQEAKEIWRDKLSNIMPKDGILSMPDFNSLMVECDKIVERATKNCKVLIRTGRE